MSLSVNELVRLKDIPFSVLSDDSYLYKINSNDLIETAKKAYNEGFIHLSTIVGYEQTKELFTINYPLFRYETENYKNLIKENTIPVHSIVLSVNLPYTDPKIPSILSVFNNSSVYERELVDILGIKFIGQDYTKNEFL